MKIWIVSSDPFLKEFEKIAKIWAKDNNEIVITTISKFGYKYSNFISFYLLFLKVKPNIILTDHGYNGFSLINTHRKIFNRDLKINTFLRGNYWLEEEIRNNEA